MSTGQASRPTAATVTADGALAKGKHNPVDATSGTRTMTLPTGVTVGAIVSIEKVDSSVNPVIVSGTIRGSTSTITLYDTNETRDFVAESSSSWRPLADHRPRAALRGRRSVAIYDEFSRYADGTLSGKTPIAGPAWATTGASPTAVTSGKAGSASTGYLSPASVLSSKITGMACEMVWAGSGNSSSMTMIASSDASATIANAVHFNYGPTGFLLTLRKDAGTFDTLIYGPWKQFCALDGSTVYRFGMLLRGNTVVVIGPFGEVFTGTDPRVGALNGTLPVWEPNTGAGVSAQLLSVTATTEATSGQMTPTDIASLHGGGGFAIGPNGQTAGNRNLQHEVSIGLDGTTNMPAITFGATTIFTTLTTAVAIGDTAIVTRDAIPSGSTVQIESGTNSESLTTNASPTGTAGVGPYTEATSSAATKVHAVGSSVSVAVPLAKRAVMYFNVTSGFVYLPNNNVVFSSAAYFGTALDVQIARLAAGLIGVGSAQMIRTGIGATGSRPAASTGAGAQWQDSTVGIPIWSTGSQWADANGYVNQLISRTTSNNIGLADKVTVFNGASLTATLPDPTTVPSGSARITTIKNVNASALTVASAGTSKTIDGAASASLAQWAAGRYVSDGTQWLSV